MSEVVKPQHSASKKAKLAPSPSPTPSNAGRSHFLRLTPPIGYLLISLIVTWPMITHLQGWVPGSGDWGQNLWALWWTRYALLALGQAPYYTSHLFYPEGVTLLFHPLDVSDGLLAIPLYGLLGGDITYNVMILLSFVLGGWGTYLLALYLTGQRGTSLVVGLIFMLSPYHFLRIDLGHLNLSTLQWIPFYALFALKFVREGAKRSAVLAVLFLVLNALNSWYYVIYCGLLSLALVFWPNSKETRLKSGLRPVWESRLQSTFLNRISRVSLILIVAVLILFPLLLPMFQLLSTTTLIGEHNPLRHSVDLYSFWIPGPPSTWAGWFEDIWIAYAAQNREPGASAYLGYTVFGLSLIGLIGQRWRRQALWWLTVAVGFTLLAMGPQLQIDGQTLNLPLPYQLLSKLIPAFSITGIPGRFVVMTSLALALLAAYGLATLTEWIHQKIKQQTNNTTQNSSAPLLPRSPAPLLPQLSSFLYVAVALLIILEYLAVPLRLTATNLDDFYYQMAADTESYAILDIKWDANFLLHAQTAHSKPLVGGWLARLPEKQAAYLNQGGLDKSFLYLLLGPQGKTLSNPAAIQSAVQAALTKRNVRYIIDHDNVAEPFLEQFVGWPVVYEGDEIVVYENQNQ